MFLPLAVLYDDLGYICGLRVALFDVKGINASMDYCYTASIDVPAFPQLITNFRVVDWSVQDILKVAHVNYTQRDIHTRLSENEIVDEEIDTTTLFRCDVISVNGQTIIRDLRIPGLRNISYIKSDGTLVSKGVYGDVDTVNGVVCQLIGATAQYISLTNMPMEYMRQKQASCQGYYYNPRPSFVENPVIRACLPAKVLIVAPNGKTQLVARDTVMQLLQNKKISIGNAYLHTNKGITELFKPNYYLLVTFEQSCALQATSIMSDLCASGLIKNAGSPYSTSIRELPKDTNVILPEGSPAVYIYDNDNNSVKNFVFPKVAKLNSVLNAKRLELTNLKLPEYAYGPIDIEVCSTDNLVLPQVCTNSFMYTALHHTGISVIDTSKYIDCGLYMHLGYARALQGVIFNSAPYGWSGKHVAEFSAQELHSLKVFKIHEKTTARNIVLRLDGLSEPKVALNVMAPIRNLELNISCDALVDLYLKHCGIGRLTVNVAGNTPLQSLTTEALTTNTINSKSLSGVTSYQIIRKYKK